ncbi:hypothetical protein U1Q18_022760, partial [Sarracenia purpurea var. burkii]
NPSSVLLMLVVIPFLACLFAAIFLWEIPSSSTSCEEEIDSRYFKVFNVISFIIGTNLSVFDVTGSHRRVSLEAFAAVLLILIASPLSVPMVLNNINSLSIMNLVPLSIPILLAFVAVLLELEPSAFSE